MAMGMFESIYRFDLGTGYCSFHSTVMPRRPPPTSLRLVQGPVPARSVPKHTMPSVPRPTFSQPAMVARGPAPRQQPSQAETNALLSAKFRDLPELEISIPSSLPSSVLSASPVSSRGSMRGPWDHSGSISLDVASTMLARLEPVALV